MGSGRLSLVLFLLLAFSSSDLPGCVDARPLRFFDHRNYAKVLASLGLTCRCCDGEGGECRTQWDSACAEVRCHPWKFL
ncbi:unnamed protein product [Spirodela intermedia]|uniref:Uncharacterized protein n=1 Tax=Spirodela intermedia TaxID=51605 RepID=A0A7I8K1X3_SPIIN|nr:unnamed protein product [Spirodela intermedia]